MIGLDSKSAIPGILQAVTFTILFVSAAETTADTDLWGHTYFGRVMVRSQAIERTDPYSFTSDRPWTNHEWLAELLMGGAYAAGGSAGLLGLKLALLLMSLAITAWSVDQRLGRDPTASAVVLFAGMTGVLPLLGSIRPQGFSVLLFAALLATLVIARSRPRVIWIAPLIFGLWANLHGGWVMALGIFGAWLAARSLRPGMSWRMRFELAGVGLLSMGATCFTPFGFSLWDFMWETLRFNRSDIVEWQAITYLPELFLPWGLTVALAVWALGSGRVSVPDAVACVLLAAASFRVARLVPFFSLAVALLVLPHIVNHRGLALARWGPKLAPAIVAGFVIAAMIIDVQGHEPKCFRPSGSLDLDPDANSFIRTNNLRGRVLVWFNWGEYAIWHFSPALKVSMDGRRETVYSKRTLDAHEEFYMAGPTAQGYLAELSPEFVWLPNVLPVSEKISAWGWRRAFATELSTIWVRDSDTRSFALPEPPLPACFPGP